MKLSISVLFVVFGVVVGLAQQPSFVLSSEADITASVELAPCKGRKERRDEVVKLFKQMGATETEVVVEKIDGADNVVVTKKGTSEETVIVGAHYDKADTGCGAIDNWTGVAIVANLYKTLRTLPTKKNYKFVAFDKEEVGLIGSDAMAGKIPKDKRDLYCAMVNFDSFGFALPQALANISSKTLMDLAREVSGDMKIEFANAGIGVATSDSKSFLKIGIPAITLHGLSNDWEKFLHTPNDKTSKINMKSVYLAYRHGLVLLMRIEERPCGEFRAPKQEKK